MTFLDKLIESIEFLWPFRRVDEWEAGGYYIHGRFCRVVGPGIYFVIPWFEDIKKVPLSSGIEVTRKLDITLEDKSVLYLMAAADRKIIDVNLALNSVDDWKQQAGELLEATISDELQRMDVARLHSGSRKSVLRTLSKAVKKEAAKHGLYMDNVRFQSFVTNARTHRVIMDTTPPLAKEYAE